jgi:type I restriction enzyme S subunit
MLSDKTLRIKVVGIPPEWLLLALRSPHGRNEIERLATGNQESMRNIGQDRIRRIRIPLPPLAEQQRIIAEIERRRSVLEELEAAIRANVRRAERLRQTILKRAFEGKLVPQDPDDEPASVLLDRIRAERNGTEPPPRRRATTRAPRPSRRAAPGMQPLFEFL